MIPPDRFDRRFFLIAAGIGLLALGGVMLAYFHADSLPKDPLQIVLPPKNEMSLISGYFEYSWEVPKNEKTYIGVAGLWSDPDDETWGQLEILFNYDTGWKYKARIYHNPTPPSISNIPTSGLYLSTDPEAWGGYFTASEDVQGTGDDFVKLIEMDEIGNRIRVRVHVHGYTHREIEYAHFHAT